MKLDWFKLMQFGAMWGCHQKPERSFFYKGYQFPVCARCTGILLGQLIGMFTLGMDISLGILILMLIPVAFDGGIQLVTSYSSNNLKRIITGVPFGISTTYISIKIIILIVAFIVKFIF